MAPTNSADKEDSELEMFDLLLRDMPMVDAVPVASITREDETELELFSTSTSSTYLPRSAPNIFLDNSSTDWLTLADDFKTDFTATNGLGYTDSKAWEVNKSDLIKNRFWLRRKMMVL